MVIMIMLKIEVEAKDYSTQYRKLIIAEGLCHEQVEFGQQCATTCITVVFFC
jgi:hypothetical protein